MGGAAFTPDGLETPRMPTAIYEQALNDVEQKLRPIFQTVMHSLDAPEKADHGDIDVLTTPLPRGAPLLDEIAKVIDAKKFYHASVSNGVMHFAIPWPGTHENENGSEKFIQVDLTICTSESNLHWRLFAHGHGDLVNILASTIRHKGLTLTSQALYLRVPNLETSNKKSTRIELSQSPEQVLSFLGLDAAEFWTPFSTRNDMMSYIATCRFFDPARLHEQTLIKREELTKASLNTRDKSQLENRPLFRYWYDVFIPDHEHDPPGANAHMARAEVEEEAFAFFGGDTRQRFNKVKHEVGTILAREKLWSGIKLAIKRDAPNMDEKELHDTLRAVRREIVASGDPDPKRPELSGLQKAYLTCDWATVHDWAVTNHAAALARWKELVARSRMAVNIDERKANKYSTSELETYTDEDDRTIMRLKANGMNWGDILATLGKKSKSQLQAHWKNDLQIKEV